MKLKPLVASLFVLGLVSGSALAASGETIVQNAVVDQNSGSRLTQVCTDNWFNRVSVGGFGTIQATWGDTDPAGTFWPTNSSTDLYVNNFNVMVNAVLNSWTKATVNLAYVGYPTHVMVLSKYQSSWSGALTNIAGRTDPLTINLEWAARRSQDHKFFADEAYVTFANFCKSPFYFKVGKTYVPFGTYSDPYNFVLTPMTQQLAQSNQTAAVLGFATDMGLYGNVYGFRGNSQASGDKGGNIRNVGAELGYFSTLGCFDMQEAHYNINAGIIRAMQDGDFWLDRNKFSTGEPDGIMPFLFHYSKPVPGVAVHGDLTVGSWNFFANYVQALENVQIVQDVPGWAQQISDRFLGGFDLQGFLDNGVDTIFGSNRKIWAADVNAEYAFKTWCRDSKIGVSYQFGGNADFMARTFHSFYPKNRIQADYKVNILKNVDFDLAYAYNTSFSYPTTSFAIAGRPIIPELGLNFNGFAFNSGLPQGTMHSNVVVAKLGVQF